MTRAASPARQAGLSLIEIMISIVIVGIVLAVGLPSFQGFLQNAQIRNAAESLLTGLTQARSEAIRRNRPVEAVLTETSPLPANVSSVTASTTGRNWVIRVVQASGTYTDADFIMGKSFQDGAPNVTLAAGASSIRFSGVGRPTPTMAANVLFNFTNPKGDRPLRIVVTPGGIIRLCDPALPTTNPQAC